MDVVVAVCVFVSAGLSAVEVGGGEAAVGVVTGVVIV